MFPPQGTWTPLRRILAIGITISLIFFPPVALFIGLGGKPDPQGLAFFLGTLLAIGAIAFWVSYVD